MQQSSNLRIEIPFFFNNQHHAAIRLQGALHFCTKLKLPHYPEIVVNKHGWKSEGGFKANTHKCKLKKTKDNAFIILIMNLSVAHTCCMLQ